MRASSESQDKILWRAGPYRFNCLNALKNTSAVTHGLGSDRLSTGL